MEINQLMKNISAPITSKGADRKVSSNEDRFKSFLVQAKQISKTEAEPKEENSSIEQQQPVAKITETKDSPVKEVVNEPMAQGEETEVDETGESSQQQILLLILAALLNKVSTDETSVEKDGGEAVLTVDEKGTENLNLKGLLLENKTTEVSQTIGDSTDDLLKNNSINNLLQKITELLVNAEGNEVLTDGNMNQAAIDKSNILQLLNDFPELNNVLADVSKESMLLNFDSSDIASLKENILSKLALVEKNILTSNGNIKVALSENNSIDANASNLKINIVSQDSDKLQLIQSLMAAVEQVEEKPAAVIKTTDRSPVEIIRQYIEVVNVTKDSNLSQQSMAGDKQSSESFTANKEDKLLAQLTGNDTESQDTSKASLFSGMLKNLSSADSVLPLQEKALLINKATVAQDVLKSVKYMEANNIKELTVRINPKELGEVIITVAVEAGRMKANISASSKEAYGVLSANFSEIKNQLAQDTVKIHEFNINIYNGDTTFFKDGSNQQEQQTQRGGFSNSQSSMEDEFEEVQNDLLNSQIDMLA